MARYEGEELGQSHCEFVLVVPCGVNVCGALNFSSSLVIVIVMHHCQLQPSPPFASGASTASRLAGPVQC
jgi:hypothetical protein